MPPLRQPKTLYEGCLIFVNFLVDLTCEKLAESEPEYLEYRIDQLKRLLGQQLPPSILDDVCETRRLLAGRMSTAVRTCEIKLRVYMHEQMRRFKIDTGSHECHVTLDDLFWQRQIFQMSRIQTLDLHLVCTDEILEIVSNFCANLQEINIVSRVVQETSTEAPCIRIRQFVSDSGLLQLTKCPSLRCVIMNKKSTTKYSVGRTITSFGVRALLETLPKLEYINYSDMSDVFDGINLTQPLNLKTLLDSSPNAAALSCALAFCPDVVSLNLSLRKATIDADVTSREILECLASCQNDLKRVEMQGLHTVETLGTFLEQKGESLQILSLNDPGSILSSRELSLIGNSCPNLTSLCVRDIGSDPDNRPLKLSASSFRKLRHLSLSGRQWNFTRILGAVLTRAQGLEKLTLLNLFTTSYELDEVLGGLLKEGHLRSLQDLNLKCGCYVTLSLLKRLLKKCKSLEKVTMRPNALLQKMDADLLVSGYLQKNYNVTFNFDG